MVNLGIFDHLYVIYLRKSMAGNPLQDVDPILGHGQWPSTVTLGSARSNSPPTCPNLSPPHWCPCPPPQHRALSCEWLCL